MTAYENLFEHFCAISNATAQMQNPAATAYESEYQAKWRKSETRDELEASYRRTMPHAMRLGSFLNDYADRDECEEVLSRLFAASYRMSVDQLACAVIKERETLINKHAERMALADSED